MALQDPLLPRQRDVVEVLGDRDLRGMQYGCRRASWNEGREAHFYQRIGCNFGEGLRSATVGGADCIDQPDRLAGPTIRICSPSWKRRRGNAIQQWLNTRELKSGFTGKFSVSFRWRR